MLLTEKRAKKKWCPHARFPDINDERSAMAAINMGAKCEASGCMAWRWRQPEWVSVSLGGSDERHQDEPDLVETPVGYCGLAGKP